MRYPATATKKTAQNIVPINDAITMPIASRPLDVGACADDWVDAGDVRFEACAATTTGAFEAVKRIGASPGLISNNQIDRNEFIYAMWQGAPKDKPLGIFPYAVSGAVFTEHIMAALRLLLPSCRR